MIITIFLMLAVTAYPIFIFCVTLKFKKDCLRREISTIDLLESAFRRITKLECSIAELKKHSVRPSTITWDITTGGMASNGMEVDGE